jgi:hypothetical protein
MLSTQCNLGETGDEANDNAMLAGEVNIRVKYRSERLFNYFAAGSWWLYGGCKSSRR